MRPADGQVEATRSRVGMTWQRIWNRKAASPYGIRRRQPRLIQPFLPPEVPERGDVCQAEGKPVQILVPHVRDRVAPVFQSDATAVPVVGGLSCCKLHLLRLRVES